MVSAALPRLLPPRCPARRVEFKTMGVSEARTAVGESVRIGLASEWVQSFGLKETSLARKRKGRKLLRAPCPSRLVTG